VTLPAIDRILHLIEKSVHKRTDCSANSWKPNLQISWFFFSANYVFLNMVACSTLSLIWTLQLIVNWWNSLALFSALRFAPFACFWSLGHMVHSFIWNMRMWIFFSCLFYILWSCQAIQGLNCKSLFMTPNLSETNWMVWWIGLLLVTWECSYWHSVSYDQLNSRSKVYFVV
jgi:hypothetical protein